MSDRPTRRRPAEVRALLLDAAAFVFAAKGFRGGSTAEIATAAGVSESALFRHFNTKADLFAAAAVEPFIAFMDDFARTWERRRAEGIAPGTLMREFVTELYDRVAESREIVQALLVSGDDAGVDAAQRALNGMFDTFRGIGEHWSRTRGIHIPGLEIHERILVGTVTSMVLFDRWFLCDDRGDPLPREAAIDALVDFAHHGAVQRGRELPRPD